MDIVLAGKDGYRVIMKLNTAKSWSLNILKTNLITDIFSTQFGALGKVTFASFNILAILKPS